jgi:hypothetical protein
MTRERLQPLSEEVLRKIALREGIHNHEEASREQLIEAIIEALEEDRSEREHLNNEAIRLEHRKYDILMDEEIILLSQDEVELPQSYNDTRIVILLRDPFWAYAYWDINPAELEKLGEETFYNGLFLRVYEFHGDSPTEDNIVEFFDIPVEESDGSWYISLTHSGSDYAVELRCRVMHKEKILAMSNKVHSPLGYFGRHQAELLDEPETMMLMLSGLWDYDKHGQAVDEIPQRIISLLDTHNIEL